MVNHVKQRRLTSRYRRQLDQLAGLNCEKNNIQFLKTTLHIFCRFRDTAGILYLETLVQLLSSPHVYAVLLRWSDILRFALSVYVSGLQLMRCLNNQYILLELVGLLTDNIIVLNVHMTAIRLKQTLYVQQSVKISTPFSRKKCFCAVIFINSVPIDRSIYVFDSCLMFDYD